jgi:hypothetical protein
MRTAILIIGIKFLTLSNIGFRVEFPDGLAKLFILFCIIAMMQDVKELIK